MRKKKVDNKFCNIFSKPSLLRSIFTSNGPNEMFQGLKQGIIRLCILIIIGDMAYMRLHEFFVSHTFT